MAAAERKPDPALIARLLSEPGAFEFFRAVEVLEQLDGRPPSRPVGSDHLPSEVGIRFGVAPSLAFASKGITAVARESAADARPVHDVLVSFLGLVGPAGTLPMHYTETVLERLHAKDPALGEFLDALQGRSVALFYRAWRKYRLATAYLSTDRSTGEADPILNSLMALVGAVPRRHGETIDAAELAEVHHAGLFSDRRRSANGLRSMLRGLLGCEVEVEQFVGQWLELDPQALARVGSGAGPGVPARLGEETPLGTRVWSVDSRIRVVAGPLDRARFRELWPGGAPVRFLWEVLHAYLGPLVECELHWELAADAPAAVQLGGDQRLGRDCWLGWSERGRPDTRVSSPPWHAPRPLSLDGGPSSSSASSFEHEPEPVASIPLER